MVVNLQSAKLNFTPHNNKMLYYHLTLTKKVPNKYIKAELDAEEALQLWYNDRLQREFKLSIDSEEVILLTRTRAPMFKKQNEDNHSAPYLAGSISVLDRL